MLLLFHVFDVHYQLFKVAELKFVQVGLFLNSLNSTPPSRVLKSSRRGHDYLLTVQ
jgi:hypothetical protein